MVSEKIDKSDWGEYGTPTDLFQIFENLDCFRYQTDHLLDFKGCDYHFTISEQNNTIFIINEQNLIVSKNIYLNLQPKERTY